jgi:hypothetical protein
VSGGVLRFLDYSSARISCQRNSPGFFGKQAKLRTAQWLTNLVAVLCVIGWRVFSLTMTNREARESPAETALTGTEIEILDSLDAAERPATMSPVSHYVRGIAKLEG